MEPELKATKVPDDPQSDLGFGRVVSQQRELAPAQSKWHLQCADEGRGLHAFLAYSNLVSTTWSRFFLFVAILYITLNAIFAVAYVACGPGGLVNTLNTGINAPFLKRSLQHSHLGDHWVWQRSPGWLAYEHAGCAGVRSKACWDWR